MSVSSLLREAPGPLYLERRLCEVARVGQDYETLALGERKRCPPGIGPTLLRIPHAEGKQTMELVLVLKKPA